MIRKLKYVLLTTLLASCGANCPAPANPQPISKCKVFNWEVAPDIPTERCGDKVCIRPDDALILGVWIARSEETFKDLAGCPFIEVVSQ